MMENFEFEYDENEVKHNPWSVKSMEEFRFYNCPECDHKESILRDFVGHALECHPKSGELLDSLDVDNKEKHQSVSHPQVYPKIEELPIDVSDSDIDSLNLDDPTIQNVAEVDKLSNTEDTEDTDFSKKRKGNDESTDNSSSEPKRCKMTALPENSNKTSCEEQSSELSPLKQSEVLLLMKSSKQQESPRSKRTKGGNLRKRTNKRVRIRSVSNSDPVLQQACVCNGNPPLTEVRKTPKPFKIPPSCSLIDIVTIE